MALLRITQMSIHKTRHLPPSKRQPTTADAATLCCMFWATSTSRASASTTLCAQGLQQCASSLATSQSSTAAPSARPTQLAGPPKASKSSPLNFDNHGVPDVSQQRHAGGRDPA